MSVYKKNLAVIAQRWPEIAHGIASVDISQAQIELVKDNQLTMVYEHIQVASSFDQVAEAKVQIQQVPIGSAQIFLYGTGLGSVQTQLLIGKELDHLNVVIMNMSLFKAALTHFLQLDWLTDQKVKLLKVEQVTKVFSPFIALPAELVLADNNSARLRDQLCLALDDPFIELKKGQGNQALRQIIADNLHYIQQDKDVGCLFKASDKRKFIVCGAGPTLESHFPWLADLANRQDFFLVAVDAAVAPLATIGVIPDLVVSIDPVAKKLFNQLQLKEYIDTALVYFPVLEHSFLASWCGQRYIAYSTGDLYNDINEKVPRGRLYSGGSVIHPAIDLSVKMGAKAVFLLGCDFSFPEGKTHTFWQEDTSSKAIHLSAQNTAHWVLNSKNERVPTLLNFRGYLRDLEQYIALTSQVDFFNGSDKGALITGTRLWGIEDGFD